MEGVSFTMREGNMALMLLQATMMVLYSTGARGYDAGSEGACSHRTESSRTSWCRRATGRGRVVEENRSTEVRGYTSLSYSLCSCDIEPFEDEIHPRLRFAHRGLVAMANNGAKNSNDSQFFITLGEYLARAISWKPNYDPVRRRRPCGRAAWQAHPVWARHRRHHLQYVTSPQPSVRMLTFRRCTQDRRDGCACIPIPSVSIT